MKFAAFDVDGTLVELAIPTHFIRWLEKKNKFPEKVLEEIHETIRKHENGEISWEQRGKEVLNAWAKGFKGTQKKELQELSAEFVKDYDKIFLGSVETMNYLKKEGYYLIAVSRAFEEILEALKIKLPFDFIIGTKLEAKKGVYTGKVLNELWHLKIKKTVLLELIKEKNLDLKDSFAFGDTEQDSFMMELAENPVPVQPSKKLRKVAEKNGWKCFEKINDFFSELEAKGIQGL
ncbi:MAG: HAD family phosphatase [archaeon]